MLFKYDADAPVDVDAWRATPEAKRIALIKRYHVVELPHSLPENLALHAAMHHIVEKLLVEDERASVVLARLIDEGFSRHNAVHTIAMTVWGFISEAQSSGAEVEDDVLIEAIEALRVEETPTPA